MDANLLRKPIMSVNTATGRRKLLSSAYHAVAMLIDLNPGVPFDAYEVLGRLPDVHASDGSLVKVVIGKFTFFRVVGAAHGRTPMKFFYILDGETGCIQTVVGVRDAAQICACHPSTVSSSCDVDHVLNKKYFVCSSEENAKRQFAVINKRGSFRKHPLYKSLGSRPANKDRRIVGIKISFNGVDTYTANGIDDAADFLDCSPDMVRGAVCGNADRTIYDHKLTPIYEKQDAEEA